MIKRFSRNELLSLEYEQTHYNIKCLAVNTYYFGHENDQKALTLTWADRRDIKETSRDIFRIYFEIKQQEKLIDTLIDNLQMYRSNIVRLYPDADGNFVKVPLTTYTGRGLSFLNNIIIYGWMKEADFNRISPRYVNNLLMDYPELIDTTTIDDLDEKYSSTHIANLSESELKKLFKVKKFTTPYYFLKKENGQLPEYSLVLSHYNFTKRSFDNYNWMLFASRIQICFATEEEAESFRILLQSNDGYEIEIHSREESWIEYVKVPLYISTANIIQYVYIQWSHFYNKLIGQNSEGSKILASLINNTSKESTQSLSTIDDLDESIRSEDEWEQLLPFEKFKPIVYIIKNGYRYASIEWFGNYNPTKGFDLIWEEPSIMFPPWLSFPTQEEAEKFLDVIKSLDTSLDNAEIKECDYGDKYFPEDKKWFLKVKINAYGFPLIGWIQKNTAIKALRHETKDAIVANPAKGTNVDNFNLSSLDDLDEAYNIAKVSAMNSEELKKLFDVIKVNKYYRVRRLLKNSKDAYYNYPVTQLCYDSLDGGFDYCWNRMISNFQRYLDIIFTSKEEAQIFLYFIATSDIRKNYDLEIVDVNLYASREIVKIPIYISTADIIHPVYVEWTAFFQQTPDSTLSVLLNNPITNTKYKKQSLSTLDDLDEG